MRVTFLKSGLKHTNAYRKCQIVFQLLLEVAGLLATLQEEMRPL